MSVSLVFACGVLAAVVIMNGGLLWAALAIRSAFERYERGA